MAHEPQAHVIIVGNEKGGSGKTTTSMHLVTALLRMGFRVASIDLDSRQKSLTRYLENRAQTMQRKEISLPMPEHQVMPRSTLPNIAEAEAEEKETFEGYLTSILPEYDFILIDSLGSDTYLSRLAHSYADTIITPVNDSFLDLDVLAVVDPVKMQVVRPSIYSEAVWKHKIEKAARSGTQVDWIVMRNRLSNLDARNKRNMEKVLRDLGKRVGFRTAPGFSERVIFRELFLQGLTVLDVLEQKLGVALNLSHVAARQEVRDLLRTLDIPAIQRRLDPEAAQTEEEGEEQPAVSAGAYYAPSESAEALAPA